MIDVARDFERMRDYLVGRSSDDERRTIEERLLRDPELVREFEQSLRLPEGLAQIRAQGYFETGASRAKSVGIWLTTLVAAVLAGLALFLWAPRTMPSPVLMASPESRPAGAGAREVTARFTFVSLRDNSTPNVDVPPEGLIELRAAPVARTTGPRYRLTLLQQEDGGSTHVVGTVAGLALSPDGYVHCYADAIRLRPGSYVLRIDGDTEPRATALTFPFNLRAGGGEPRPDS
ncbi:MAG: hypothetical protein WCB10_03410 [Steroidobacteraceae bacterium]